MTTRRARVLFVAEAVTLAQVVRLVSLARGLDPRRYEVHFASARFDELVFASTPFVRHAISSPDPATVERAVARGARMYGTRDLARFVDEDLALFDAVEPDVVVGDLRWSLAVSAPLRRVPHAALINAYWSPHAERESFPLPDHPVVRWLGLELAERYFPKALPWVMAHHAAPLDRLRRRHGLAPLGGLTDVLTHGDITLFPDTPSLVPTRGGPRSHVYLGPIHWSPELALPSWWSDLRPDRPVVYVTLGSSGRLDAVRPVLEGLTSLPVEVVCATAGRLPTEGVPAGVRASAFLPGHLAARRASVVVSNGGSTTGYQALAEGTPVLGIPSNLDQYLASDAIARAGAGLVVRGDSVTPEAVRGAVERLLVEPSFRTAARAVQRDFGAFDAKARFAEVLRGLTARAEAA